jgi:hypothetical protein
MGILKKGSISAGTVIIINSRYDKINRVYDTWRTIIQNKFFTDSVMRKGELKTRIREIL